MAYKYTDQQRQINYSSATTGIIADVRDIIEIDPLDNTKIKVKAPYTIKTVDATTPSNIITKELDVPITSGIVHDIPAGFTYWIGVKDNSGTPLYNYHFTLEEFDLTEFAIIGRAFTDEAVSLQLNGVVGTFWWEGWNYGKTLYDFATAKELSFTISGGEITPDVELLTYTREEGIYWRFMSYSSLKNPNKGTDPQTAITAYFTYSSAGGFEQTSTFEVGFIDDGAGGKTAVPANNWSIYKIFHFASSNFESAQRGKQTYESLNDARTRKGEEDLALNSDNENAAFTHIAYVKSGATDLNNIEEVIFEKINPNSLSSGGDSTTGALVQSGVIDWVGDELLTINGTDNTKFDVTEFRVGKVDRSTGLIKFIKTVSALSSVTVPAITTSPFTYISYDIDASSLILSSSQATRVNLDNVIPLGRLWHRNNINLDQAQSMQLGIETIHDYVGQLLAFGALKQSGLSALANGANKKINLINGVVEIVGGNTIGSREGINLAQPGGESPLSFTPVRRQVTTEKAILETATSDIDFTVFDDGSGTLATIGNQKFGINYICIFPFRSITDAFLIRGNKEYATHAKAKVGLAQDIIKAPSDFKGALCVIAIIAKKETTDLEAAILADDASITAADRFGSFGGGGGSGGGSANLQSAYEAGGEPELVTNATRGAVTLKRGSAADTDNVLEILNGAGTVVAEFTGEGKIGIGTSIPSESSILDLSSTTKGFLPPRMTPTQRDAIVSPATGLIVYDNVGNKLDLFNSSVWRALVSTNVSTLTPGGIIFATEGHHIEDDPGQLNWDTTDKFATFGKTEIGTFPFNGTDVFVGHSALNHANTGNYALRQNSVGKTFINSGSGQTLDFQIAGASQFRVGVGSFNLLSGSYLINSSAVLSTTTLASSVVNSSLTNVGVLTNLTMSGTSVLQFNQGGRIRFTGGSGNNFIEGNISNTGRLGISTDNTERITITLAGNVGIGETAPETILHISQASPTIRMRANINNDASLELVEDLSGTDNGVVLRYLGSSSNNRFSISTLSPALTERFSILRDNGFVGIGVTDPDARLEVNGQIKITGGTPGIGRILTSDANGLATWETASAGGWIDNGTTITLATSTDFVGIGAVPLNPLHIQSDTDVQLRVEPLSINGRDTVVEIIGHRDATVIENQASLIVGNFDSDLGTTNFMGSLSAHVTNDATNIGDLIFYTYSDGVTQTETMRLTSTNELTLAKSTNGIVANLGNATLRNRTTNDFTLQNNAFTADVVGFGQNTGGKITIGADSNTIDFFTGVDAVDLRMIILNNGNIGIGTSNPSNSTLLELSSTIGALLITRLTTTQKNALTAINGMIIYDSTLNKFQGRENGAWTNLI